MKTTHKNTREACEPCPTPLASPATVAEQWRSCYCSSQLDTHFVSFESTENVVQNSNSVSYIPRTLTYQTLNTSHALFHNYTHLQRVKRQSADARRRGYTSSPWEKGTLHRLLRCAPLNAVTRIHFRSTKTQTQDENTRLPVLLMAHFSPSCCLHSALWSRLFFPQTELD